LGPGFGDAASHRKGRKRFVKNKLFKSFLGSARGFFSKKPLAKNLEKQTSSGEHNERTI
jgi:hypothetical protein